MAVKIRLARRGKKGYAFYHIVVADARAPRDGKFIENIGSYNPNTNPATITLDFDKAYRHLPCDSFVQRCIVQKTLVGWCSQRCFLGVGCRG